MPTRDEWVLHMQRQVPPPPDASYRRDRAIAYGERAKTVLDHPGWIEFERIVNDEIAKVTRERDVVVHRLLNSVDPTVSLEPIRFELRHLEALLVGMKFCVELMPKAVEAGLASVKSEVATR